MSKVVDEIQFCCFWQDCEDPNPLIRALAVRTMGCIRVDKITEYLCEPLRKCLKDEDPYVRKTAAVCVAKLYDINAQLVEDQGFLDQLKDLLSDSNPMVVANAVAALSEINESTPSGLPLVELNGPTISKLLTALNECTEWGQVFILDSLSNYSPKDDREAQRYAKNLIYEFFVKFDGCVIEFCIILAFVKGLHLVWPMLMQLWFYQLLKF